MKILCLMVSGGPLDDGISTAIYLAACSLIRSGEKLAKFQDENGSGGVETKHKRTVLNSTVMGIEFIGTVESRDRTIKCKFLVNDTNIPDEDEVYSERFQWKDFHIDHEDEDDGEEWKKG
jgi:hypothetical protein